MTAPQYYRPINADTGQPTLAVYFTAPLCQLVDAWKYDLEARNEDLISDVRDHLDQLGIPIRPTIAQSRKRVIQVVEDGEEVPNRPEFFSTVMAFFTDAEPEDPRLTELAGGFHSDRLDAQIQFEIPTVESEAELERSIAADKARGEAFIARSMAEAKSAAPASGAATGASTEWFDELYS